MFTESPFGGILCYPQGTAWCFFSYVILGKVEDLRGVVVPRDMAGFGHLLPPHASLLSIENKAMEDFKPEFYQIPIIVASKCEPHESFVYAVIYWFAKMKEGHCWASNERIANSLPYKSSSASVANAIGRLSELGLIHCIYVDDSKRNRKEIIPLVSYSINPQVKPFNPQVNRDTPTGEQIEINKQDKIVLRSQNVFSEDDELSVEMVDDNGDPIKPRTKATKDPLIELFRSECKKQVGISPVIPMVQARTLLKTARQHLTDKQIEAMFKDWFALGKPDNETMQITRALSTARINTFKADNGIK